MTDLLSQDLNAALLSTDKNKEGLTRGESDYVEAIASAKPKTIAMASAGLASAFLVYRTHMRRRITEEVKPTTTPSQLSQIAATAFKTFQDPWREMVIPHLMVGMLAGLEEVKTGKVPDQMLKDVATSYANDLGEHINGVSVEALLAGYQTQLNRKVPPARAMQRVLGAFGVSPKTMNSLVNVWLTDDPKKMTDLPTQDHIADRAKVLINAELQNRADGVGQNESWASKEQTKQLVWLYGQEHDLIPKGTTREWRTALDERVCPSCGPMHGKKIDISEKFTLKNNQKLWAPPAHPRCRCVVRINWSPTDQFKTLVPNEVYTELVGVTKVRKDDRLEYKRDQGGRFSSVDSRGGRTQEAKPQAKVKERTQTVDPVIADVLRQVRTGRKEELDALINQAMDTPEKVKLSSPEKAKLGTADNGKAKLTENTKAKLTENTKAKLSEKVDLTENTKAKLTEGKAKLNTPGKVKLEVPKDQRAKMTPVVDKIRFTTEKVKLRSKADIQRDDPLTVSGEVINPTHWQQLDTPLVRFIVDAEIEGGWHGQESEHGEVYLDEYGNIRFSATEADDFFFEYDDTANNSSLGAHFGGSIGEELGNYWNFWVDSCSQEYMEDMDLHTMQTSSGHTVDITYDMWDTAVYEAVAGLDKSESSVFGAWVAEGPDDTEQLTITAADIIDYFGIKEQVHESAPTLAITNYAMPGVADIHPNGSSTNPGSWVQSSAETYMSNSDGLSLPHKIVYLRPEDLDG